MREKDPNTQGIPILNRQNHEKWFRRMKLRLEGKDLFYSVEKTKEEFAWINRATEHEGGDVSENIKKGKVRESEIDNLTTSFQKLGGCWNDEKALKFHRDESKLLSILTDFLSEDDQNIIDEYLTAKQVWSQLKKEVREDKHYNC